MTRWQCRHMADNALYWFTHWVTSREKGHFFFKTEISIPPGCFYDEKHSVEILELCLSFCGVMPLFFFFHANHAWHIDMHNFERPPCKTMWMSLVSLFSWRSSYSCYQFDTVRQHTRTFFWPFFSSLLGLLFLALSFCFYLWKFALHDNVAPT